RSNAVADAKLEQNIADLNKKIESLTQLAAYMRQERDDYAAKYRELQNRNSEEANIYVIEFLSEEQLAELLKTGLDAEAKGHYEVAIWHFQKILERLPNHFEANYHLGEILNRRERFQEAEKLLQRAAKLMPEHVEANMALITSLAGQNKFGNAFQILQPLLKNAPTDGKLLNLAADVAFRGGDYAAAEKYAAAELAQNPKSSKCNLVLAQVLTRKGDEASLSQAGKYYQSAKQNGALPDLNLEEKLGKYMVDKLEVIEFMQKGAAEALGEQDYLAAAWYYGELFKLQSGTRLYQDLFRYYSIKGGNAEAVMLDWKIPDDDQLSMVLAAWGFLKLNDSAEAEKLLNKVNAAGGLATNALPAELKSLPEEIKKSLEQPSKDATLKKIILMTTNTIS
ncbi:MAG: tetratricopeptide repeat protein, partial [Victivallaceae bacterium]